MQTLRLLLFTTQVVNGPFGFGYFLENVTPTSETEGTYLHGIRC